MNGTQLTSFSMPLAYQFHGFFFKIMFIELIFIISIEIDVEDFISRLKKMFGKDNVLVWSEGVG